MATSAASSVFFYREFSYESTNSGNYVYHGDATSFHEWEFRTESKVMGKADSEYSDAVSKIIAGLRADAFVVAHEVGLEPGGTDALFTAMKQMVFPLIQHEAKELFRLYCKNRGPLARQTGESMTQYVSRRKRCWKLLTELDAGLELSEGHRQTCCST